jgi:hypothetical protein
MEANSKIGMDIHVIPSCTLRTDPRRESPDFGCISYRTLL